MEAVRRRDTRRSTPPPILTPHTRLQPLDGGGETRRRRPRLAEQQNTRDESRSPSGVQAPARDRDVEPADLEYAQTLLDVLVDRQASDVVLLDLTALTVFTDYFVIGTVDNIRQARAITDALGDAAAKAGRHVKVEGDAEDGWILVDAGDGIFVHLFSLEARLYYDLEGLWHRAQEIVRVQ